MSTQLKSILKVNRSDVESFIGHSLTGSSCSKDWFRIAGLGTGSLVPIVSQENPNRSSERSSKSLTRFRSQAMRWCVFYGTTMIDRRILLLLMAIALSASAQGNKNIIKQLKDLAFDEKVEEARSLAESERENRSADDPELLAALSWVARGASFAKDWKTAQAYAQETYKRSSKLAKKDDVDSSPMLATALGASIEVLGSVYLGTGKRDEAITFLKDQRERYRGTSIESRIQKNYLLASLEGQPMPALNPDRYVGESPPVDVQGKVVVYYFWAHWCGSSKRQKPALIQLHQQFRDQGLVFVGPTKLFGFSKSRKSKVSETEELAYVEGSWQKKHPLPEWMSKPMKQSYFSDFGVSTTPTLVIADRQGVVRLYHPGLMTLEELEAAVVPLL